jgi:hypothetical protein
VQVEPDPEGEGESVPVPTGQDPQTEGAAKTDAAAVPTEERGNG